MPPRQAITDVPPEGPNSALGSGGPDLDADERKKAKEEESLNASITYETIRREGEKELERPPQALAWSGLAAGLSMGFILVAEGLLRSHLPDTPWRPLVAKLGYTVGFLVVMLGSQQLYTENTLTPIVPLLARKSGEMLGRVLRLWAIVLVSNLIGTIVFAWVLARTTLFDPDVHVALLGVASETLRGDFATTMLRAIFAGWLIALMVWMLPGSRGSHVAVIVVMTYLVGVAGLAHIIAGSTEVAYLVARGSATWGDYFGRFVLPTLIGNTLGGVTLVAALNHAQVTGGKSQG
jgi:formate/nitrite transporter FocA (FNT family)